MSDVINALSAALGEELETEAAALAALERAEAADPVPARGAIEKALPEKGVTVGLHRLLSRALEADSPDLAESVLVSLTERLNQAGYWQALTHLTRQQLESNPRLAAPLIARARTQCGTEAVDDDLLEAAHRAMPGHGLLAWQVAEARAARDDHAGARRAASEALIELIEEKNYDQAEGALLMIAEDDRIDTARVLTHALELLARQEAWELFDTAAELAIPVLSTAKAAPFTWPVVRDLWARHPERDGLRATAARVVESYFQTYPRPEAMLRTSEIERPSQPPEVVLERIVRVLAFPPGYYVRHMGWGIGPVRDNDTEALVIDFPAKPVHRMSMSTAQTSLFLLAPDDLQVLLITDPEGIRARAKSEPVEVVILALKAAKEHEATTEALRKAIVPEVVPSAAWSNWWKSTRKLLAEDSRIDTQRAYEKIYRLKGADEEEEDVTAELPEWKRRAKAWDNLETLDTFLQHLPGERERVLEAYRTRVEAVADDSGETAETRTAAVLWLERHAGDSTRSLEELVRPGFDMARFGKPQQEQLVARLETVPARAGALGSRLAGVRRSVWSALGETADRRAAAESILEADRCPPEAVLFLAEETVEDLEWDGPLLGGLLLRLLDFLETPPRETHRKRMLALVKGGKALHAVLQKLELDERSEDRLTSRLIQWSGSDRHRFPFLDLMRETGHPDVVERVEGHRARAAARVGNKLDVESEDPYDGSLLMTRPTYDRLTEERRSVGMELKTTIPRAIQQARELGDLKENAEYDAAKSKQANYAKRFEELDGLLRQARLVEEIPRAKNVALPGTELELEATGGAEDRSYWLLGEGDQDLDTHVVSYRAAAGRALLGKRVGETVELPGEAGAETFVLRSVRERLP